MEKDPYPWNPSRRFLVTGAYLLLMVLLGFNSYMVNRSTKQQATHVNKVVYSFCEESNDSRAQTNAHRQVLRGFFTETIRLRQVELERSTDPVVRARGSAAIAEFQRIEKELVPVPLSDCRDVLR